MVISDGEIVYAKRTTVKKAGAPVEDAGTPWLQGTVVKAGNRAAAYHVSFAEAGGHAVQISASALRRKNPVGGGTSPPCSPARLQRMQQQQQQQQEVHRSGAEPAAVAASSEPAAPAPAPEPTEKAPEVPSNPVAPPSRVVLSLDLALSPETEARLAE